MILPTLTSASWSITALYDSLRSFLAEDTGGRHLRLFFYAAKTSGWNTIRASLESWLTRRARACTAYIGTDHGLTDPDALDVMRKVVNVRIMVEYRGNYHSKVIWCEGAEHRLWIGSNNLTDGGFRKNIECAVHLQSPSIPQTFTDWFQAIHAASEPVTPALISSYRKERDRFARKHPSAGAFTWSKRREPRSKPSPQAHTPTPDTPIAAEMLAPPGSLIVQVMPRETGPGGKQLQFPMAAVGPFFHVPSEVNAPRIIRLRSLATGDTKQLTMTVYSNRTVRLSISELDYSDRPCVIVFTPIGANLYQFEIVQRAAAPDRYRRLLRACRPPTRSGSRRWIVL